MREKQADTRDVWNGCFLYYRHKWEGIEAEWEKRWQNWVGGERTAAKRSTSNRLLRIKQASASSILQPITMKWIQETRETGSGSITGEKEGRQRKKEREWTEEKNRECKRYKQAFIWHLWYAPDYHKNNSSLSKNLWEVWFLVNKNSFS